MDFKTAIIALVIGVGGTLGYQSLTNTPNIEPTCTSSTQEYSCRFFNKGSGTGAVCVQLRLVREKPNDAYLKNVQGPYDADRLCSGPLTKGQDSERKGKGFYAPDGNSANAAELCQLKGVGNSLISGCDLKVSISARTAD